MRRVAEGEGGRRAVVTVRQHGVGVQLATAPGVFSAARLDPGTALLLRLLSELELPAGDVVDLGCGYGPLGLWLAAADPTRTALLVDRDALAVEVAAANAATNGVADRVAVGASLGWDDVTGTGHRLVVSNVPAKVGAGALRHLLVDAACHVADGAVVAVVVVDRLRTAVGAILGDPAITVVGERANRGYLAVAYRFDGRPATADDRPGYGRGVYGRGEATFTAAGRSWTAATSRTVDEFDTLGHATVAAAALLDVVEGTPVVAVFGVGQGHLALAMRARRADVAVRLVDRDLLALRTAAANLGGDVDVRHVAHPDDIDGCRALVAGLAPKASVALTAAELATALQQLPPGAPTVVHGRAADVSRVLELLGRHDVAVIVERRSSVGAHAAAAIRVR